MGLARRSEHDDRRERSGRDHHAQRDDRRSADVTWSSWLNQPTAQIYHVSVDYRFPYWVTGAQQDSGAVAVRSRGKFARDLDARLGADRRRRRERHDGGRSAASGHHLRRHGTALRSRGERAVPRHDVAARRRATSRTDWTQPLVFSKADPHALYYANQFLFKTTDGAQTWTQISPRPHAAGSGRAADPRCRVRGRHGSQRQTRRHLHDRAVAAARAAGLGRHRRWADSRHARTTARRWQNVTPPAMTAWSRVTTIEASHFDAEHSVRERRSAPAPGLRAVHLSHARHGQDAGRRSRRGLPAASTCTSSRKIPMRRGLLFAGTERGDSCRSTTATTGSRCSSTCRSRRCATSRSMATISSSRRMAAASGSSTTSARCARSTTRCCSADAYLFKPADAINVQPGRRQRNAAAEGRAAGAEPAERRRHRLLPEVRATGPVTLEILDASGACLAMFTSAPLADPDVRPPVAGPAAAAGVAVRRRHPQYLGAVAPGARAVFNRCRDAPDRLESRRRRTRVEEAVAGRRRRRALSPRSSPSTDRVTPRRSR